MWGPAYLLCLYSCVLWATKYNLLKSRFTAYQHGQVTPISRSYWVGHVLCLHSILLPTATSTTGCNRAFCINCLHLLLSSIIKQIFIECLLCARHEVRTVGIQQWMKQSLPLRPSSSEEKENRFMKSYNARLNLSSPPPPHFGASCLLRCPHSVCGDGFSQDCPSFWDGLHSVYEMCISPNKFCFHLTMAHSWILSGMKPRLLTWRPVLNTHSRPRTWPSSSTPLFCSYNTLTASPMPYNPVYYDFP